MHPASRTAAHTYIRIPAPSLAALTPQVPPSTTTSTTATLPLAPPPTPPPRVAPFLPLLPGASYSISESRTSPRSLCPTFPLLSLSTTKITALLPLWRVRCCGWRRSNRMSQRPQHKLHNNHAYLSHYSVCAQCVLRCVCLLQYVPLCCTYRPLSFSIFPFFLSFLSFHLFIRPFSPLLSSPLL
mgnify:CR=1 FL=1